MQRRRRVSTTAQATFSTSFHRLVDAREHHRENFEILYLECPYERYALGINYHSAKRSWYVLSVN